MGVELHVLQCVRKEVLLRYAICLFYIYPRLLNTTVGSQQICDRYGSLTALVMPVVPLLFPMIHSLPMNALGFTVTT